MLRLLTILACVAACACGLFGNGTAAQVVATGQCEHAFQILKSAKAAGKTCAQGKAEAARAEPQCPMVFDCARPSAVTPDDGSE
jgi:hypothetical protein